MNNSPGFPESAIVAQFEKALKTLDMPPEYTAQPFGANDQFIWVMGGRMYIGTGSSVDKDKTVGLPKGSYIHDFANGTHYDGTKDEDLWLLVAGMGPAAPERVE